MKKTLLIILSLLVVLSPVMIILSAVFIVPPQFSLEYTGELNEKVDRLMSAKGEKVVVIGGSSVAFALDSELMEEELGKPVINFGLYAGLGTKLMLDLSRDGIKKGDIVILAPELDEQTLSLFFSTENTLAAIDDDKSILAKIPSEHWFSLIGGSWQFSATKFNRFFEGTGDKAPEGTIYSKESFNEYGDIKAGLRPENIMSGYFYDRNKPVDLKPEIVDAEFIEYVNDYIHFCEEKGATVYFAWCPINEAALQTDETGLAEFSKFMQDEIDCDFIGLKNGKYVNTLLDTYTGPVIDKAYFYDSNFHLNDAGVTLYTVNLINNLYLTVGDFDSYCTVEIPAPPELPDVDIAYSEYDENEIYFTSELGLSGMIITGLTEEGKKQKVLTIPVGIGGFVVSEIGGGAFAGSACETVIIPENSRAQSIGNGAFGNSNVSKLYIFQYPYPNGSPISPYDFLDTVSGFKIYVPNFDDYDNGYEWANVPNRKDILVEIK